MFLYFMDLKRCRKILNHSISWWADRLGDFVVWPWLLLLDDPVQCGQRFGVVKEEVHCGAGMLIASSVPSCTSLSSLVKSSETVGL